MVQDFDVTCIAASQGAELIALGTENGDLNVWDALTGTYLAGVVEVHAGSVTQVVFTT